MIVELFRKMLFIRWIVKEIIPYKNLDYIQEYLQQQIEISKDQNSNIGRLIWKFIWFQFFILIRYLLLFILPLSDDQRILTYDIFFILDIHYSMNLIGIFLTALGMFLIYKLYIDMPKNIIRLMNIILFSTDGSGFILCSSFNCLTFDLAQYLLAHCYIMCIYIFTFITWTLFLKLDQINLILNRNKTINENHPRYYSRIVNRFIWLHGHTFIHVNHFCNYLSDLFSSYMIANFPMNMLFIVTTFIIENNANKFYSWKFFAFGVIVQQFIGFFIIHLICSLYTIKIHKCSPKLIYCRIHFPLQPLSLRLRTSLYIEKIHTKNQYGIVLARTKVISMIFFIKFITYV
ncbi:uncharacterized protein LOC113791383 [Dermatophagoides pteronyssinus]|uniref:uncharacterized protein LOC113791383 n=1 Tax=Dermatophagoides pteronyssinus TaxID=6956 RepID=UPI003F66BEFB